MIGVGTIDLELTVGAGTLTAGHNVPTTAWTAGFDHAALVTASRSRADGFDLRLEVSGAKVGMTSISGANTTACKIAFNSFDTISAPTVSLAYTLKFGNLGRKTTPFTATPGTATGASVGIAVTATEALALPSPAFPVSRVDVHDVEELAFPEWRTSHRSLMNENARKRYGLVWRNISPEDYYAIRAVVRSVRGVGVLTTGYPAVLVSSGVYGYRIVPGSFRCEQTSRLGFGVELELEEAFAA